MFGASYSHETADAITEMTARAIKNFFIIKGLFKIIAS